MKRKGLGKGLGMGYKNLVPMDSHIHSLSAKGHKTYVVSKVGCVVGQGSLKKMKELRNKLERKEHENYWIFAEIEAKGNLQDKILTKTGWRKTRDTSELIRFSADFETIEIYSETIGGKKIWFIDVIDGDKIKKAEYDSKNEALDRAYKYMLENESMYGCDIDEAYPSQTKGMKLNAKSKVTEKNYMDFIKGKIDTYQKIYSRGGLNYYLDDFSDYIKGYKRFVGSNQQIVEKDGEIIYDSNKDGYLTEKKFMEIIDKALDKKLLFGDKIYRVEWAKLTTDGTLVKDFGDRKEAEKFLKDKLSEENIISQRVRIKELSK